MKVKKFKRLSNSRLFFTLNFFDVLVNKLIISIYYSIKLYLKRNIFKSPYFPIHKRFDKIESFFYHFVNVLVPFLEIIFHVKKKSFAYNDYLKGVNTFYVRQDIYFYLWCLCYPLKPISVILHNFSFNLIYGKNI